MKNITVLICLLFIAFSLTACTPNEEVWTGQDKNPIQVACGSSCRTLTFAKNTTELNYQERYRIRQFVYQSGGDSRVFVSPCATNRDDASLIEERVMAVKNQIKRLGYTPVRLKATLPEDLKTKRCVNLVRGKLHLYVQNCPNKTIEPSVQTISSNFGCTTNYNLAQMIVNPWNLLALGGDNGTEGDRVALGEQKYREGKNAKLDMESSS